MIERFFATQFGTTFTLGSSLLIVGVAALLGILISLTYMACNRRIGYNVSFVLSIIILPTVISFIIMLIGNNVARAFTLAGSLSIIRYRSEQTSAKDLSYLLFGLAMGLACGIGYIGYAMLFTVLFCICFIIISRLRFGERKYSYMTLKILMPENLNYQDAFDDILKEYTTDYEMLKVRTTDFGTMFEVTFRIAMLASVNQKEFIDKLRTRNGNMNIVLTMRNRENILVIADK
ncbi:MAG: DUF4956 domain-containing protein [Eubacteriales bacterium]